MSNDFIFLTVIPVIYGILLVLNAFIKNNKFISMFRIDTLMLPNATDSTRIINLFAGILIAGYAIFF